MDIQYAGLDSYTDEVWGRLPTDAAAFMRENMDPLEDELLPEIGKIFSNNKVQDRLGLYVNHQHFELQAGERLVEHGMVQTPMQLGNASLDVKARIILKAWAFLEDNKVTPTEFKFSTDVDTVQPISVPVKFVNELRAYLDAKNLTGRLGISTLPDGSWDPQSVFEFTVGRVSMIVPNHSFQGEDITNVGWLFDEEGAKIARGCSRCDFHGR